MTSYRRAGVDLDGAADHVRRIAGSVTSTWGPDVVGSFGGFASGIRVPDGYRSPVLMMTTDGVGTKLEIARRAGRWEGVGHDLVAMCVDDLAVLGARPLGLVDYMAVGALDTKRDAAIVASIAAACIEAGCALLGGETAEHPGVMGEDAVDLAATAMGIVEEGEELGPHRVRPGDVVVGLASPNLRSNGFSLIRSVFADDLEDHYDMLLEPSVIYSPTVLASVATGGVHAAAHITGGGIADNLNRSLPEGIGAVVDTTTWQPAPVFSVIAERGVDRDEMFRTFNMGIGFCLIADPEGVDHLLTATERFSSSVIGEVTNSPGVALV